MIPVVSREQIRAFDARAIGACGVPGLLLMENAGRGAADVIEREILAGSAIGARVVVVCGTGNNGGDGFVIARQLLTRGASVEAIVVGDRAQIGGDARVNLRALLGIGGEVHDVTTGVELRALFSHLATASVIVDALFGTGLSRPLGGIHADVVAAIHEARRPVVAIDIPSGLDANTGAVLGVSVQARVTVTFAYYKLGLLTPGGAQHCGAIHVADIGVPQSDGFGHAADLLERADIRRLVSPRPIGAHKNSAGSVAVFAGSPGKVGAAVMVAHAALRAGAGVATIATWPEAATAIETRAVEVMTARLDRKALVASTDAVLAGKRAVVIGPGFGLDDAARAIATHVFSVFAGPIVVDADALTLFAGAPESFSAARHAILTPHPGEAARLLGTDTQTVESDRFGAARELARRTNAVVVLKGAHSLICAPNGRLAINSTGNPALATAGAGDVLAGTIGALTCALDPFEAACAGVFLHGAAADSWRDAHGDRGMLASEIAERMPDVIAALALDHACCAD